MEIKSSKVIMITKRIEVRVTLRTVKIVFYVTTVDGKVTGTYKSNIQTSYLKYFHDTTNDEQEVNFNLIKDYIESNVIQK